MSCHRMFLPSFGVVKIKRHFGKKIYGSTEISITFKKKEHAIDSGLCKNKLGLQYKYMNKMFKSQIFCGWVDILFQGDMSWHVFVKF